MPSLDPTYPAQPEKFRSDIRSFAIRLVTGVLIVNAIVVGIFFLILNQSRHDHESRARITAQNMARILEHDIANIISKIDSALLDIIDEANRQTGSGGMNGVAMKSFITRQHVRAPEFNGLLMTNASGDVVINTLHNLVTSHNVADRDYFKIHYISANAGLYISRPLQSRFDSTWLIVASRRINRPDGSFLGVVMAALSFDYFSQLFASQEIGAHGGISLRDAEMGIIARYPAPLDIGSIIGNKTLSPELRTLFEAGKTEGTFYTPGSWDNTAKIVSYRKIGPYPLHINVGLATRDYLAGWRRNIVNILMLSTFCGVVTLFLAWGLFVRYKREKHAEQARAESERRFYSMANSAPVLIWVSGLDSLCTWFNSVWLEFTGRTLEEETGNGWAAGVHPDDRECYISTYASAFEARKPFRMEYRLRRADGIFRWLLDHGIPRFDDSGNFAGYIGSCVDISDSREYQSQLKSLASELALAQERERRQIAVNLHDYVVQDLAFARIRLNLIQRSAASADLQKVIDIIDGTIGKLRNLLFDLSSTALYELGIVAALEGLGERFGKEYGFSFSMTTHQELTPVTENIKITLYQVARELLLNAAKHSRADRVKLTLSQAPHMIRLAVEDNGTGFDVDSTTMGATAHNNFGLFSIRQRVNHLGGRFEIVSGSTGGTRAQLAIPLSGDGA